jgi:hypothetical protein
MKTIQQLAGGADGRNRRKLMGRTAVVEKPGLKSPILHRKPSTALIDSKYITSPKVSRRFGLREKRISLLLMRLIDQVSSLRFGAQS